MEAAFREMRRALAVDVLERVREQTPDFFEQVVLDVLQAIGYGGSRDDAAERLGRGGDGGATASSVRTSSASTSSTFKQSDGRTLSAGQTSNSSSFDHDVGVTVETTYPIRKIDLDYFGVEEGAPPAGGPEPAR